MYLAILSVGVSVFAIMIYHSISSRKYLLYCVSKASCSLVFNLLGATVEKESLLRKVHKQVVLIFYMLGDIVLCYKVEYGGFLFGIGHLILLSQTHYRFSFWKLVVTPVIAWPVCVALLYAHQQPLVNVLPLFLYMFIMASVPVHFASMKKWTLATLGVFFLISDHLLFVRTYW